MQKGSTKFFAYFRPSEPKLGIDEPQWNFDRPDESLEKLYQYTVEFARGKVRFYYEDAEKHRKLSTIFRAAGLIALTIGGRPQRCLHARERPHRDSNRRRGAVLLTAS